MRGGADGVLAGLITRRSEVRVLLPPLDRGFGVCSPGGLYKDRIPETFRKRNDVFHENNHRTEAQDGRTDHAPRLRKYMAART